VAGLPADRVVGVSVLTSGEGILAETLIGLAAQPGEARSLFARDAEAWRPLLEDEARPKAAFDVKATLIALRNAGFEGRGFTDDPTLYSFLTEADPAACVPETMIQRRLGTKPAPDAAQWADMALQLALELRREVEERGLADVYHRIDLPLAPVLARMETSGVRIEPAALRDLSGRMESEIERLAGEIHGLAGRPFNINSPQQLAEVLYEELHLPAPPRSGKTKSRSTAADVLESLAEEYRVAQLVLDYRQLVKLKGTYVDALPALVDPRTGRLHTTFNQTGAATGRLSSSNPNLQNIPIRTELGREIRAAIVPEPGWRLIVADYSQIELRLLAHFSRDPVLVDAFRRGEDIHTRTAAEVFGTPPIAVTPELRRRAKAVNFGIVYGLSAFGLANQLGIPRDEAERYIRSYFERYRGVRKFIDGAIDEVRRTGKTRTLFGRERPIPDINSRNPNARGFAERTAVNTPLQGTAADLIKLAMIRIDGALASRGLRARMILQVHDELLFEAPPEEAAAVAALAKKEMEEAGSLEVPLVVDIGIGDNWRDAK
jgi:DNA polymerase-1